VRIENCILTGDFIVTAPLTRTEAEEEWIGALSSGAIPTPLFDLIVERLSYLSEALHRSCRTANISCSATSVCSLEA
jgi:hypothetical protein